MKQFVIVRHNCETFVVWADTKEEALAQFADAGHSDAWKVLMKREASTKEDDRGY